MNTAIHRPQTANDIEDLIRQVESLRLSIEQQAERGRTTLPALPADRYQSAENLLHYLALRSRDVRPLQDRLARLGLSSLGRLEAHVMATINAVLHNLYLLSGLPASGFGVEDVYSTLNAGADQLEINTARLLGERPKTRRGHIMVTASTEVANDYLLVHQLLSKGMNCMRINCVHDDPPTWFRMIEHLRNAEQATGRSCRVLMDLGGPKLRLGAMETEAAVVKIRPLRDKNGHVLRPARVWLTSEKADMSEMPAADANLCLDPAWLEAVEAGDSIRFCDVRGSRRRWRIREVTAEGCWAEAKKTAYVANGTVFQLHDKDGNKTQETTMMSLAPHDTVSLIRTGDILIMTLSEEPGTPAVRDSNGELLNPGRVSLAIPEVYRDARLGEPVHFDDGRISGIVEKRFSKQLQIRITHTRKPVEQLEGRRGLNFPDTDLNLPALSARDKHDLEFVVRHADMVGLSFTNGPNDVRALYQQLQELGCGDIGVVFKIETKRGFSNLPAILMESLKFPTCGIMIARGDLAVECGFERMSEIQEEMLWVCESAHVPVIWATQVLEDLTKRGHATRAEITDAAMAQAAEAVMLNKGPHVIRAVEMLDDILQRMQGHFYKKRSMLRKLHMATGFSMPNGRQSTAGRESGDQPDRSTCLSRARKKAKTAPTG